MTSEWLITIDGMHAAPAAAVCGTLLLFLGHRLRHARDRHLLSDETDTMPPSDIASSSLHTMIRSTGQPSGAPPPLAPPAAPGAARPPVDEHAPAESETAVAGAVVAEPPVPPPASESDTVEPVTVDARLIETTLVEARLLEATPVEPAHAEPVATGPSVSVPALIDGAAPVTDPISPTVSASATAPHHAAPAPALSDSVAAIRETRRTDAHRAWASFRGDARPPLLFHGGNRFRQFSADRLEAADEWFVIGDIHGDFFALHAIVSFIRRECPGFGIIFLGDLIDRGPHSLECLWYLLGVAAEHPDRVLWLAGNHDIGARFDETEGVFRATVEPAEFVSDLNVVDGYAPLRRAFGRDYIALAEGLPRAVVMPDGLLLTHGGFPHTDLQADLAGIGRSSDRRAWLESEPVIRDFTHLRISRYPVRRPNRFSISCSYGSDDFLAFRRLMHGYHVERLVTGHEHAERGFNDHPEWASRGVEALTLTGFGFANAYHLPSSYAAHYRRTLVVGRCRPGRLPEVIAIPVDEDDLMAFFHAEIATLPRFAAP